MILKRGQTRPLIEEACHDLHLEHNAEPTELVLSPLQKGTGERIQSNLQKSIEITAWAQRCRYWQSEVGGLAAVMCFDEEVAMKVFTEFVGTFIFLFAISLAAVGGSPLAPLAIGGALMVMVYMGGHRSGAHYNPAVSFGLFLQKKIDSKDFVSYVVAQIVAGVLAFGLGAYITGKTVAIEPGAGYDAVKALLVEIIFTMALVLVVMNTAASKKTEGKGFYGLAIGFTIVVAAIAGGPVSGGAFNPAVGIGATVLHATQGGGSWSNIWIPIVGPLVGGAIASFFWKAQESALE